LSFFTPNQKFVSLLYLFLFHEKFSFQRNNPEEEVIWRQESPEDYDTVQDTLDIQTSIPIVPELGKRGNHAVYGFGLGKRSNHYAFGLGKRLSPYYQLLDEPGYWERLGKRNPYTFGLGKRQEVRNFSETMACHIFQSLVSLVFVRAWKT